MSERLRGIDQPSQIRATSPESQETARRFQDAIANVFSDAKVRVNGQPDHRVGYLVPLEVDAEPHKLEIYADPSVELVIVEHTRNAGGKKNGNIYTIQRSDDGLSLAAASYGEKAIGGVRKNDPEQLAKLTDILSRAKIN